MSSTAQTQHQHAHSFTSPHRHMDADNQKVFPVAVIFMNSFWFHREQCLLKEGHEREEEAKGGKPLVNS